MNTAVALSLLVSLALYPCATWAGDGYSTGTEDEETTNTSDATGGTPTGWLGKSGSDTSFGMAPVPGSEGENGLSYDYTPLNIAGNEPIPSNTDPNEVKSRYESFQVNSTSDTAKNRTAFEQTSTMRANTGVGAALDGAQALAKVAVASDASLYGEMDNTTAAANLKAGPREKVTSHGLGEINYDATAPNAGTIINTFNFGGGGSTSQ